jgi:hypothetical protein
VAVTAEAAALGRARVGEPGRALLQRRFAAFALIMVGAQLMGTVGIVLQEPAEHLWQPWFAAYQLQTALPLVTWLILRRGRRSTAFVAWTEVGMLTGLAILSGLISRLLLEVLTPPSVALLPPDLASATTGHVVGLVHNDLLKSFTVGLSLWVFVRAAIVPSHPLRTGLLTAMVGLPLGGLNLVGALPLLPAEPLRATIPPAQLWQNASEAWIWWAFITAVCAIVSAVTFGLRREVRAARRFGQYTLEAKLGEGGMGAVYRARHALMRRPTAIKLVPPGRAGETTLARFEREVQLTAKLTHPNTVTIFDYGRTEDGVFYYAMELLDGATLGDVVKVDGPQSPGRVLRVLAEVAGALEEAHGVGLVHRDIKPSNVILCERGGRPDVSKLLDFGLVKELGAVGDAALTADNALTGTPHYMSPESLTAPEEVDARGDLYALGAVGYFLLTAEHVFPGATTVEVLGHHLHTPPVRPSERAGRPLPEDLEGLILRCLRKDPSERPQSARALRRALEACEDMGAWTEEHALEWWQQHGPSLRADDDEASFSERTLAVAEGLR